MPSIVEILTWNLKDGQRIGPIRVEKNSEIFRLILYSFSIGIIIFFAKYNNGNWIEIINVTDEYEISDPLTMIWPKWTKEISNNARKITRFIDIYDENEFPQITSSGNIKILKIRFKKFMRINYVITFNEEYIVNIMVNSVQGFDNIGFSNGMKNKFQLPKIDNWNDEDWLLWWMSN